MRLIDTNILIYSEKASYAYLRDLFEPFAFRSVISTVEVLGFARITPNEKLYFETIFETMPELTIVSQVAEKAIELRQMRKMSLGDSFIASTALVYGLELYTNNITDFSWIPDIQLYNPII